MSPISTASTSTPGSSKPGSPTRRLGQQHHTSQAKRRGTSAEKLDSQPSRLDGQRNKPVSSNISEQGPEDNPDIEQYGYASEHCSCEGCCDAVERATTNEQLVNCSSLLLSEHADDAEGWQEQASGPTMSAKGMAKQEGRHHKAKKGA
ncbi:MAG: hypothetical protein Q9176_004785 [Flavoplaca citrina]